MTLPESVSLGDSGHRTHHDQLHAWFNADGDANAGIWNIKHSDYGATGDGTTDDSAAIQAAIDACIAAGGGVVFVPPGNYQFGTTLLLSSDVQLVGTGPNASILDYTGAAKAISVKTADTRTYRIYIRDLRINDSGTGTVGVDWDSISNGGMTRVFILNFDTGLDITGGAAGFSVYNAFFDIESRGGTVGVSIDNSSNENSFFGCRLNGASGAGGIGIKVDDTNHCSFVGCSTEASQKGVVLDESVGSACRNNTFLSHRFENNTTAVEITAGRGNMFIAPHFASNSTNFAPGSGQWSNAVINAAFKSTGGTAVGGMVLNEGAYLMFGDGTPESSVSAPVGSLFLRTDGGASTTLYVKESGTGNTGWVAK